MKEDLIEMSSQEIQRLEVIQKVISKHLSQLSAAKLLSLTTRHLRRLCKAYKKHGAKGLISKQRGGRSNHQHSERFKEKVVNHVKARYSDFGPTFAAEKLLEEHKITVNKETLRQWMIEIGLWRGKKRRQLVPHQQRARRSCFGELAQIDGSPHAWFEERGPKCCLLVFIDDATGKLLELHFEPTETTLGYFKACRKYFERHGRPLAFYSDKNTIFRVQIKEALSGDGTTQFSRAMQQLGVTLICANTPQAKGRVERANSTLQDRLVKELRLRGISDIETANAFLPKFMNAYNKKFSVAPVKPEDAHRKELPSGIALETIFTYQSERKLSKNLELSYNRVIYQVQVKDKGYALRYQSITVCDDMEGQIKLLYKKRFLPFKTFEKRQPHTPIVEAKALPTMALSPPKQIKKPYKPKPNHPWLQYTKKERKSSPKRTSVA